MVNKQGDIRVIYDESNVIYIDPNKLITDTGEVVDRAVIPEDFVMYANLETKLIPRTKLLVGNYIENNIGLIQIGRLNFMKPNTGDDYFTSSYYDELTGDNSLINQGKNQKVIDVVDNNNNPYFINTAKNVEDNTLLGIKSIAIRTNSSFVPTVTIIMEDVQGRALFSLGNDSPYAAFFNLPYPPFYLTIKGYYGKAVRYELVLNKFNASYNANNGDYTVTLDFLGYKYNVLTDINMGHLIACPNMYSKKYQLIQNNPSNLTPSQISNISSQTQNQVQSSIGDKTVFEVNTHIGYQKIIEVYKEYKAKGLIDSNLPELTLTELIYKLEMFEQNVLNSLNKVDVQKLTDGKLYKKLLSGYYQEIRGGLTSWFNKYLDPNPIILNDTNEIVYGIKKEYIDNPADGRLLLVESDLANIISKYNVELANNPTFGVNGTSTISNTINYDLFIVKNPDINWCDTYKSRNKSLSLNEIRLLNTDLCRDKIKNSIFFEYTVGTDKRTTSVFSMSSFIDARNKIESKFINELNNIEKALSEELALKIEKKENGIGFKPTIKNVVAVVLATTEGFLRLMEDVHVSAWDVRNDEDRVRSVLGDENVVKDDNNSYDYVNNENKTVFPWPLVAYRNDKKDANKYELIYPGDPTVANITKAFFYDKWPEVEFVEEFINGYNKRVDTPNPNDLINPNATIQDAYTFNTIEYPFNSIPYELTSNYNFFYEFWDRLILASYYTGFSSVYEKDKRIGILIKENEFVNIKNTLSKNSIIFIQQLKKILFSESGLNYDNYKIILESFSNGVSEKYNRYLDGIPNTKYISDYLDATSKIYDINEYKLRFENFTNNLNNSKINTIQNVIQKTQSDLDINFTYPFTNTDWVNDNLINNLQNKFDTKKTLFFNSDRNLITNFNQYNDIVKNRPFKFFPEQKALMSGLVYQDNYGLTQARTMISTPLFINSIQLGVSKWRAGDKHPYVASAYLFLNSLPLSPLTDFFITKGLPEKNGHVFATFIKYGGLHKLPYAWILKYGSIWHRYKEFIKTGTDFLDNIWKDFDYKLNYNSNPNFVYNINGYVPFTLQQDNEVNLGFYPVMLTDFNVFLNGYDLFTGFTNTELNINENRGLKIIKSLSYSKNGLNFNGYTTLVPQNIYDSLAFGDYCDDIDFSINSKYYVLPSINNNQITNISFTNTNNSYYTSVDSLLQTAHNGAISMNMSDRYNSFTFENLKKPLYNEYLNSKKDANSYSFLSTSGGNYASIEDIFSVFDYDTLDLFEKEFLEFSNSIYDIDYQKDAINYSEPSNVNKNFQFLFRKLMEVPSNYLNLTNDEFYKQSATYQNQSIVSILDDFLNFDVLFKFGNPTQYNRYYYNSFINHIGGTSRINNPKIYNSYKNNLALTNSDAWEALRLYVGFSTITPLEYKNSGSYITDFFIDNNIEFTETNVIELSKLIKIYATQKLKNPNFNRQGFLTLLIKNQDSLDAFLKDNINETLRLLERQINNIDIVEIESITSGLDSKFSKYELYEAFKSINDKWISSSNYTSRTLFEDVIFIDRGGRNIGDLYYVDIFDLKKIFTGAKVNLKMPVFNFLSGIISKNNFNVFPMPSYVNFYGALSPNDSVDDIVSSATNIANDVWGTYTNVDYRKSGPKLVCVFAGRGSTTPNGPKDYRFGDDSIDMLKPSKIPFLEDQTDKKDWAQSNKCVSFLVDAGIRNQAIFYGIQVDQNNGSATMESLIQIENARNSVSNRLSTTQNVSLFNLYKNLSYKSTITCFGNAIIQPTMYFNLEHVPMFGGPYFITEVSHNIAPGSFETTFTGTRQSIYAPPSTDSYLSSINENLLSKIESNYSKSIVNDNVDKTNKTNNSQSGTNNPINSSACANFLYEKYNQYEFETKESVSFLSPAQIYSGITSYVGDGDKETVEYIYIISYLASFDGTKFKANYNNFGNVWLNYNREEIIDYNEGKPLFFCTQNSENTNIQTPFAMFSSFETYVKYMISALGLFKLAIDSLSIENFTKIYVITWLYGELFTSNQTFDSKANYDRLEKNGFFDKLNKKYKKAQESLRALVAPAQFSETQKEGYIDSRNKSELVKLSKFCDYTFNNIKIDRQPNEPIYSYPYNLKLYFETTNANELLYLENINKTIEDTLIKLYAIVAAPKVTNFDIKVTSGEKFSILFDITINKDPNDIPFVGFKVISESGSTLTEDIVKNLVVNSNNFSKGNQNSANDDKIDSVKKITIPSLNIRYYSVFYTKLILYPILE